MGDLLKGNFTPKKKVVLKDVTEGLNERFEREALKRLGGSIAFVSKKKFIYAPGEGASKDDAEKGS